VVGGQAPPADRLREAAAAVRSRLAAYESPDFADAPGPDAALFLCAIDHSSGYEQRHLVDGEGPYSGSDLLWHLGCAAERRAPGTLSALALRDIGVGGVEDMFRIEDETISRAEERARLWCDLATGLIADYGGSTQRLLEASEGWLRGAGGLIERLARSEAYSDPLEKKSFLFAKIAARRDWIEVRDTENWEVCADNVLMRLTLRAGLVEPGDAEVVRAGTRAALKALAREAEVPPPVLDDLLWELGRSDPDLLGTAGNDLDPPPRPPGTWFY